jgi:hypothetical protein
MRKRAVAGAEIGRTGTEKDDLTYKMSIVILDALGVW